MKFNIIKKKASSLKELKHETIEINHIQTLYDLLYAFTLYEYEKQSTIQIKPYQSHEIDDKAKLGKISFELFNNQKSDLQQAITTMIQDYKDGLFRVYLNGEECLNLDEQLNLYEENEIVFIKLVMLAGRLW